jgi:hypothetical protein
MTHLPILAAIATLIAPLGAEAATLVVYQAQGDAFVDDSDPSNIVADFFDTDGDDIDVAISGLFAGDVFGGSLLVSDAGGTLLQSSLVVSSGFGFDAGIDTFGVLFGDLTGTAATTFGDFAFVLFSYSADDALDGVYSPVSVDVTADVAPIPLPASLPLLLAGIGGLAFLPRNRA